MVREREISLQARTGPFYHDYDMLKSHGCTEWPDGLFKKGDNMKSNSAGRIAVSAFSI